MADPIVKITGIKELQQLFRQLPDATGRNALYRALLKAAEPAASDARFRASADEGNLRKSIHVTRRLQKNQGKKEKRDEAVIYIGVSTNRESAFYAPHAHLVEFGTGPRYHGMKRKTRRVGPLGERRRISTGNTGKYVGEMPAKPFLRPAWDANAKQVEQRFGEYAAIEIQKAVARLKRKRAKR